ncbi:hypothetical protein F5Y03DRAFT_300563 [Xylaria venustula]|nr:hypothetical protein F5Y03DRAFT_300563 [Xylaria venustula]
MADICQLDLRTFEVSSKTFDLSVSMTSRAFIYGPQLRDMAQDELISRIRTKQLWLLPRGLCRLDTLVHLSEFGFCEEERNDFLDLIADTVCQSPVWSQLGLSVQILDVQHHAAEDDRNPNLYFGIGQPDMSSALLSPPHIRTAQLKGLECILQFQSPGHLKASSERDEQIGWEPPLSSDPMISSVESLASHCGFDAIASTELWDNATHLIHAAFCVTLGTCKRMPGLSVFEPEAGLSLLDLAPAIWNSWYQRSIANHTKNFPVISNIFACSLNGQSPELRRKAAELLKETPAEVNTESNQHSFKHLESSIKCKLWDLLLQGALEPTMGARKATSRNTVLPETEFDSQHHEVNETMVDAECFEQFDLSDEHHYLNEELLPPPGQSNSYYQSNTSYNSNEHLVWEEEYEPSLLEESQLCGIGEPNDCMGRSYCEADISDHHSLEPFSQHLQSDLAYSMGDEVISGCTYDEFNDICDYENDYIVPLEQGYNSYDPIETTTPN